MRIAELIGADAMANHVKKPRACACRVQRERRYAVRGNSIDRVRKRFNFILVFVHRAIAVVKRG
jgi:hypothetical protein